LRDARGREIEVTGTLTRVVYTATGQTFYCRYGELFALGCSAITVLLLLVAVCRGIGRKLRRAVAAR
jgi:apolipoprotein N-acyltransferase